MMKDTFQKSMKAVKEGYDWVTQQLRLKFSFSWVTFGLALIVFGLELAAYIESLPLASADLTLEQKAPFLKKRNAFLYAMHVCLILSWIIKPCERNKVEGPPAEGGQQKKGSAAAEGPPAEGGPGGEIEVIVRA
ncbi:hypothetical protein RHMOL_Rhmol03G0287700 [Rhododendron molle]|uniref:Uncharacterized protein n=2 Tax=Rhododendron molle TaxID=49168 RepID=A0ACC0PJ72_RHOML|nr:hypothetical protein RHMOL_Rhmol03G0287400 [Rhododendron molle]KAI8565773.1 hypothetical protein RHMOL_Rhmol03G0287700 [Rhododendron molle]